MNRTIGKTTLVIYPNTSNRGFNPIWFVKALRELLDMDLEEAIHTGRRLRGGTDIRISAPVYDFALQECCDRLVELKYNAEIIQEEK